MISPTSPNSTEFTFQEGALFLIDKPQGWTSFDVVNKLRFAIRGSLGVKKIKVGHAGTLDPMATGLLLICTGKATKLLNEFQGLDKTYEGTMTLGETTPSYDAETEANAHFPIEHITPELIEAQRQKLSGDLQQLPPMFSAIKKDGQPLYKRARKGETIELEPRPVTIHSFEITNIDMPKIDFRVQCSKGTYIRSLAHDFGKGLDSGAYLSQLVRTHIGEYSLEKAWQLEKLVETIQH